jgi:adenylate cyclase
LSSATLRVADDNEDDRYTLVMRLKREGYRDVVEVDRGRATLDYLAQQHVDLVLLDVMMPEVTGYEVLERMQVDARMRDIPVIMTSALDELSSVVRCIEAGAEDYLPKPFNACS